MTSSMYAAIAGLNSHMQKMGVIGNNIANANTYGFKPGVTAFTESMYTSIGTSTAGGDIMGGTNPSQIGYGSKIAGINVSMAAGVPAPTGVNSDLYLNGNGFFMVGPKPTNDAGFEPDPNQLTLKRVGSFSLDKDGYLVDNNGNCVYGFLPLGNEDGTIQKDADGNVIYDTRLRPIRIPVYRPGGDNLPDGTSEGDAVYPGVDTDGKLTYPDATDEEKRVKLDGLNLSIGENGVITGTTSNDESVVVGVIAIGNVTNPNGLTKMGEGYYQVGGNSGDVDVGTSGGVVKGNLNGDETGQLISAAGGTTVLAGFLEASRTDVSAEFTELITTQRGFQANTKIITVTDEMLAELVNMKR